jgi:uncharacterized MAPEG superfamily protein
MERQINRGKQGETRVCRHWRAGAIAGGRSPRAPSVARSGAHHATSPHLFWLVLTAAMTGLLWLPYIRANDGICPRARLAHVIVYTLGIPVLRTLVAGGFVAGYF